MTIWNQVRGIFRWIFRIPFEPADEAIVELREHIHVENQFVKKEHELKIIILGWHNVIGHLLEIIPV